MEDFKNIIKVAGILMGGMLLLYFYFGGLNPSQKETDERVLESCLPLQYDFKIISSYDAQFYVFEGRTKEGRVVKFKLPRNWQLEGLYSDGDSIHKLAGEKELYLIKSDTVIKLKLMSHDEEL